MKIKRPWLLMYFVNAFYWMTLYTYVPIFPTYVQNAITPAIPAARLAATVGLITGSYGITQLLFRLPLGMWSDRARRRKPFVLGGIAVGIASALVLFFFSSANTLFLGRAMAGLAACAYVPLSILITSSFEREHTTRALGYMEASTASGQLTAMLAGGLVGTLSGDRASFLVAAALGAVALALAGFSQESRTGRESVKLKELAGALSERTLLVASVLAIFTQAVVFGKGFVFTNIAAAAFHATAFQKSLLTVFLTLPSILFAPVASGKLAPRFGVRVVVTAGFTLQAISCVLAALPSSLALLYVSQLLTGWGNSMIFPLLMALGLSRMADQRRATAMGFYQAVYGLGIFGGPWLTGALISALGQTAAFWINAGIATLAAISALAFIPGVKRETPSVL